MKTTNDDIEMENDLLMYSLNTSNWTAYKRDDKATQQVKQANGIADTTDAGNFNKLLLPDFKELKAINSYIGNVRNNWFYLVTVAWGDQRGVRVGKSEFHEQRLREFRDHLEKLEPLVEAAVAVYPQQVAKAEFDAEGLGQLFNPQEYPSVEEFRHKFGMRLPTVPLNNPNDIRLRTKIPAHIRADMERNMRAEMAKAMQQTTKDVLLAMKQPLVHMATTLKGYHDGTIKKMYDSLLENVLKMAESARTCNLTNDPGINALADEIEAFANGVTTKDLKDSAGLQVVTGKKAQELANRIAMFMPNA
jgi:hypothetical protein